MPTRCGQRLSVFCVSLPDAEDAGEMDEFMIERLTKRGKYEDSAGLRYFGNEKFRKKNYFGKQKLEVNRKRSSAKFRRAVSSRALARQRACPWQHP